ncbi:MAG TPA: serine/threonine-protein kinase [Polyangiaceae bacterium]|nr:serine/threonine-protein kinase [Polyangiaceae bacterium]
MPETPPPEPFRPGETLGEYILLCPLAVGGMGTVWSAALIGERGFSKLVAIKTILHEFADEVQYVRALRDEAQLAASLNHPNLCDVTELAESQGYPFLVMEWVDGASLIELLGIGGATPSWRRLEPLVAAQIAAHVCAGLHALHEARDPAGELLGAVHRDVSPHNILLTQRGHVKISDLGVAKARGQWRARTRSGELRGKLGYLAPEQLRASHADRRADVHAVGCILYLSLSGALPYPPEVASFELVLAGKYRPLEELCPDVPRPLRELVTRALKTDPDERFPTALALREALERWREQHLLERGLEVDLGQERVATYLNERLGPVIRARNARITAAFEHFVGGHGRGAVARLP